MIYITSKQKWLARISEKDERVLCFFSLYNSLIFPMQDLSFHKPNLKIAQRHREVCIFVVFCKTLTVCDIHLEISSRVSNFFLWIQFHKFKCMLNFDTIALSSMFFLVNSKFELKMIVVLCKFICCVRDLIPLVSKVADFADYMQEFADWFGVIFSLSFHFQFIQRIFSLFDYVFLCLVRYFC